MPNLSPDSPTDTVGGLLTSRLLAQIKFSPPYSPLPLIPKGDPEFPRGDPMPPNFGGNKNLKSPRIGGFRGHSNIYARGLVKVCHLEISTPELI